jgi:hypothetical protein
MITTGHGKSRLLMLFLLLRLCAVAAWGQDSVSISSTLMRLGPPEMCSTTLTIPVKRALTLFIEVDSRRTQSDGTDQRHGRIEVERSGKVDSLDP